MKLLLASDAGTHAPPSSLPLFFSAYTSGADGVTLLIQETRDRQLVVCSASDLSAATTASGRVQETDFAGLRRLNFGAKFKDWRGQPVRYTTGILSLRAMLRSLPGEFELVIKLPLGAEARDRRTFLQQVTRMVREERASRLPLLLVASASDLDAIRQADGEVPLAVDRPTLETDTDLARRQRIEAVVVGAADVFGTGGATSFSQRLQSLYADGLLARGAIVIPMDRVPSSDLLQTVRAQAFVWAVCTESVLAMPADFRPGRVFVHETFRGRDVNTELWSFGYARVGEYCHVFQDDGVHVDITPLADAGPPPTDPLELRLRRLEGLIQLALRRTPTYCGGGVGLVQGIEGSFAAEADVTSARASQATMVEIAVTNVNPDHHLPSRNADGTPRFPRNDHEKHAFFDPHGAPPFVGSEHDEDDGFRINWHCGSEYADNNYGSDVGDGSLLDISLRLERRGAFFATYVRPRSSADPRDWICTGAVRNDSMGQRVFLRCAGKRWQKADPRHPGSFLPVVPNHFVFSRVTVTLFDS